ncbi:hypothetical protein DYB32_010523, partial [Aphanomyces invadans]
PTGAKLDTSASNGAGNGTCNVVEWVSFPTIGGSPKPTTTKPTTKPKTTTPAPASAQPDGCDNCSGCYYPAGDMCLPDEYTKDDSDYYSVEYNTGNEARVP